MQENRLPRQFGRQAFGSDPASYDRVRPDYPEWVYRVLRERCGLRSGTATFEIGAGTGLATRRLLELGAAPLVAMEPDPRLAEFLRVSIQIPALQVLPTAFEDTPLEDGSFDLGVCATAFHWLDEDEALRKVARLLRPGGWWAAFWNVFGDHARADPFHEATLQLLGSGVSSPSAGDGRVPFALAAETRMAALRRAGAFDIVEHAESRWELVLEPEQVVALYATYSNVNARPDRDEVLAELGRIARTEFGGRVVRNMTTSLYIARRAP